MDFGIHGVVLDTMSLDRSSYHVEIIVWGQEKSNVGNRTGSHRTQVSTRHPSRSVRAGVLAIHGVLEYQIIGYPSVYLLSSPRNRHASWEWFSI